MAKKIKHIMWRGCKWWSIGDIAAVFGENVWKMTHFFRRYGLTSERKQLFNFTNYRKQFKKNEILPVSNTTYYRQSTILKLISLLERDLKNEKDV